MTRSENRWRWLLGGVLGLGSLAGATLGYARFIETRRLQVVRYQLLIDNLSENLEGFRIVHLTDLHLGGGAPGGNRKPVDRAVDAAIREQPDMIALTGDVVHRGRWAGHDETLSRLPATAPAVAVLGNHDWRQGESGATEITERLKSLGFRVLSNDATVITGDNGSGRLLLVGVNDPATEHDALAGALECARLVGAEDIPMILLSHAPDVVDEAPERCFALSLAGHTHGGQIRFSPFKRDTVLDFPMHSADIESQYVRGTHVVNQNPLFVGNGVGTSGVPFRFLEPPQIAVFTLTRGVNLDSGLDDPDRFLRLIEREDV